uniref:uncharacterized protein LOC120348036 n=1 Tax=Styela clava TaxID=7725 RepID=UPI00193A9E1D|nr:uncharacterized protein LOC120348036 [Styela clava]
MAQRVFSLAFLFCATLIGFATANEEKLDLSHSSEPSNRRAMEPDSEPAVEQSQKLSQIYSQAKVIAALVENIEEVSGTGNFGAVGSVKKASLSSIEASVSRLQKAVTTLLETSKTTLDTMLEFNDEIAQNTKDIYDLKRRVSALESGKGSRTAPPTRSPTSRPRYIPASKNEPCDGLLYQGRCYFSIFYVNSGGMSYEEGEDICREKDGTVGYFHRADHYKDMMKLMESDLKKKSPMISWDSIASVYIWIGLTIDFTISKVNAIGKWPIHQSWDYDYPSLNAAYTRVVVKVSQYPGTEGGMQNRKANSKAAGVLCMRSM